MTQLKTPMLAIDKIEIEEGFNVRKKMDKAKLERMAGSIEKHELVQPIAVRKGKAGKYIVVDGHRRFAAATLAGEKEVPIIISGAKNPKLAALLANMHREDLNDIETAEAIKELAAEEKWKTNTEIADEVEFSASWVGQLLRLLKLPPRVQELIASGEVPTKAESLLKPIAKVSPRIAECVCELAKREKVEPGDFVRLFPELLTKVPFEKFEDRPAMIPGSGARLSMIVTDDQKLRDLGDRYLAARPWVHTNDPTIDLDTDELDAARAAGCLIEVKVDHGEFESVLSYVTDQEFGVDLVERHVERVEKKAAEAHREKEDLEAKRADEAKSRKAEAKAKKEEDDGPSPYEERMAKQAAARSWNRDVDRELLAGKFPGTAKELELKQAKALVLTHINDNENIAACGLRLTKSQLQEVEHRQLKTTGKDKEDVTYASPEECRKWLEQRVEMARTVPEVLRVWFEAMASVVHADENELPQSKRVYRGAPNTFIIEKMMKKELKAVRPRRRQTPAKR